MGSGRTLSLVASLSVYQRPDSLLMWVIFLLLLSPLANVNALETFTETREVVDPAGTTFSCLYSLAYDPDRKVVFRKQSSVQCEPNTNGKQAVETLVIEAIGKTVSVTYQPREDKTGIKKIVLDEYVPPPTSTTRPTTASSDGSTGSTVGGNSMDCICRPNTTAMSESLPNFDQMPAGRALRYVKKEEAGQVLMRPVPLARGGGGYHGGYHGHYHGQSGVSSGGNNLISTLLVGLLGAFLGATISGLLGRSLPVEEVIEREREEELVRILTRIQNTLNDRAFVEGLQRSLDRGGSGLFSGLRDAIFQAVINTLVAQALSGLGRNAHSPKSRQLLADLLNGQANSGASDLVNQMAMEVAQQQFEQMLASGELQEQVQMMAMEMLESGQLEQMALELLQSPEAGQMADELMAEVMRPPTEEEQALMQAMVEEVMRPPTEEEMAEMEQVWTDMISSMMSEEDLAQMQQNWADWEENGGMMGAMMGMNGGMAELMGAMEMKMHCRCAIVRSVANPSERGLKHGGD